MVVSIDIFLVNERNELEKISVGERSLSQDNTHGSGGICNLIEADVQSVQLPRFLGLTKLESYTIYTLTSTNSNRHFF